MLEDLFDLTDPLWDHLASSRDSPWKLLLDVPSVVSELSESRLETGGPDPVVHPGAIVTGSYLGDGVHVYEGCTVRDSVVLAGTTIGHASEIARSIIFPECMIPRFNYVGSSLLGRGVNLGGATQLASMRYDRAPVRLSLSAGEIETGRDKYGSLLGDGVRVAYGCHVNPGSVLGRDSLIGPNVDWRGYCPPDTSVFLRQRTFMSRRRGDDMFLRGE